MIYCIANKIKANNKTKYYISRTADAGILEEPTKYLMHKTRCNCSPNTVQRIAYALAYYHCYLYEQSLTIGLILDMKYNEQHSHFYAFLQWIKSGNHSSRPKVPSNKTCNSYLQEVFGYYIFLITEYNPDGDLKVLIEKRINCSGSSGVRFIRNLKTYRGYLPTNDSVGRSTTKDNIEILLNATDSIRNKLLILILAETGLRIGEVLGINYLKDIDHEHHAIRVTFRSDNTNNSRAKNAEDRSAIISPETYTLLMLYISRYRHLLEKTNYLFITLSGDSKGKPMSRNGVYSMLKLLSNKTGISVTPHMLRHYYANARRKAGWPIERISKALGHKHIKTTEGYLHIEDTELVAAMEQYYKDNPALYDISKIT